MIEKKRVHNSSVSIEKSFKMDGYKVINNIPITKIATDEFIPLQFKALIHKKAII